MNAIFDFFTGIGETLIAVLEFIIDFFRDIAYIVKLTGEFVLNIPTYFQWLPAPALALIVTIFGVVVIYKVMGREG